MDADKGEESEILLCFLALHALDLGKRDGSLSQTDNTKALGR